MVGNASLVQVLYIANGEQRMRKIAAFILSLISIVSFSLPLRSDDGSVERIGPQLQFDPPHFLSVESLHIEVTYTEPYHVEICYFIKNNSDQDWSDLLSFTIPEREWYGYGSWYVDRSFSDLSVSVNGEQIKYKRHDIAYLDNQDVSILLGEAGLDFNSVDLDENQFPDIQATNENKAKYQKLQDAGLIHGRPEPKDADESFWFQPAWSVISSYYWKQNFPAGSLTEIKYKYQPLPGADAVSLDDANPSPYFLHQSGYKNINEFLSKICLSHDKLKTLFPPPQRYYGLYWLTLAVDKIRWETPLKRFTIKLRGKDDRWLDKLFTCINGHTVGGEGTADIFLENIMINGKILCLLVFPYA